MKAYQINDCADVPANKTDVLMSVVAKQPVAIAVQASTLFFQFYRQGVFNNTRCGQDLDHGILLTGYGSLGSQDYWECKNSWGTAWGM
jgi:xylem cysteine proteinase